MKSFVSHSIGETSEIAVHILGQLSKHAVTSGATIVGLSGQLGAGKTAFTKAAGKILGINEEITSPTFVIMKVYPITHPIWNKLVHIDAYRLEQGKELGALKFEELASDPKHLILIEWPENVKEALTGRPSYSTISFSIPSRNENERNIIFTEGPITSV